MNRIDRLFGILTLLQSKKYLPAEKISERFNISIRTVYRDIKAMCEQGIPVSFEAGKGYFIVQGYFLPPVSFSSDEANALLLMESLVYGFADKSVGEHYTRALHKIKAVLKDRQKEKLEILTNSIRLQVPARLSSDSEHLSRLQHAISSRLIVEIEYQDNNQQASKRLVEPVGLIFYAFSWHLIGWCHLRSDYRDFKVSRIQKCHCTEAAFTRTEHIPLNDYMKLLPVDY